MINLTRDITDETGDLSAVVKVTEISEVIFAVQGGTFSTGTVEVQYLADGDSTTAWADLDTTNLSFAASTVAVADIGECQLRFKGTSLTGSDTIPCWIGGTFVFTT